MESPNPFPSPQLGLQNYPFERHSRKESGLVTSSGAEQSQSLLVPGEGPSSGSAKVEGWTAQALGSPGGLSGTQGGATTPE